MRTHRRQAGTRLNQATIRTFAVRKRNTDRSVSNDEAVLLGVLNEASCGVDLIKLEKREPDRRRSAYGQGREEARETKIQTLCFRWSLVCG